MTSFAALSVSFGLMSAACGVGAAIGYRRLYRNLQRQHDALLHAAVRVMEQRDMAEARLAEFCERDGREVETC